MLLYSCEQERGRQTGGEENAEGRDEEDINGEPHQQLSSRAPPCGEEQDSARASLMKDGHQDGKR